MGYQNIINEDIRLVILRALHEDPGYSHNEYVLKSVLRHFKHEISSDKLHTELSWLAEQNLVRVSTEDDVMVAELLGRGADVALGYVVVPGVARPEPGK